jgi:hypothetical protein
MWLYGIKLGIAAGVGSYVGKIVLRASAARLSGGF